MSIGAGKNQEGNYVAKSAQGGFRTPTTHYWEFVSGTSCRHLRETRKNIRVEHHCIFCGILCVISIKIKIAKYLPSDFVNFLMELFKSFFPVIHQLIHTRWLGFFRFSSHCYPSWVCSLSSERGNSVERKRNRRFEGPCRLNVGIRASSPNASASAISSSLGSRTSGSCKEGHRVQKSFCLQFQLLFAK